MSNSPTDDVQAAVERLRDKAASTRKYAAKGYLAEDAIFVEADLADADAIDAVLAALAQAQADRDEALARMVKTERKLAQAQQENARLRGRLEGRLSSAEVFSVCKSAVKEQRDRDAGVCRALTRGGKLSGYDKGWNGAIEACEEAIRAQGDGKPND